MTTFNDTTHIRIEGKKPSFFEDIQYLWVGPLSVAFKAIGKLGIRG